MSWGAASASPRADADGIHRYSVHQDLLLVGGALADQAFAEGASSLPLGALAAGGVAGDEAQLLKHAAAIQHVELGLLGADHGGELRENHLSHGHEVFLTLEQAAELGEVGFAPVLLRVLLRGVLQIADHLVDGVL